MRALGLTASILLGLLTGSLAAAQRGAPPEPGDPIVGNWRGTLRSGQDTQSPLVITIVRKGDTYTGMTNVGATSESAIKRVTVTGNRVIVETAADSKLGEV